MVLEGTKLADKSEICPKALSFFPFLPSLPSSPLPSFSPLNCIYDHQCVGIEVKEKVVK